MISGLIDFSRSNLIYSSCVKLTTDKFVDTNSASTPFATTTFELISFDNGRIYSETSILDSSTST